MPFQRPTLADLLTRTEADVASRLGLELLLQRSVLKALADALGGASHLMHGHLDWIARQVMPDTADAEHLDRWSSFWGVLRKAATFAGGSVDFTGTDGIDIPAGTSLRRVDGVEFTTDALVTISGGTATAAVTAATAGAAGDTAAGVTLTLTSPISGVQSAATVAAGGLTGGADQEADAALRTRVLQRIQNPPHSGAHADYERWALEVAGVTRAWTEELWLGAGTVGVTFVVDDDPGGPIPGAAKVQEVQDYIDAMSRRPVTAAVTVFAPTEVNLDPTIQLTPNTGAVQAAAQASLEDLIRREVEPGGTLLISHIREAISLAAGESDHVLVSPSADVATNPGELLTLGTITWQ